MKKTKTDYKKFIEASKRVAEVEAEAEESQRPSARIHTLRNDFARSYEKLLREHGVRGSESSSLLQSKSWVFLCKGILQFLDEQYEKEKIVGNN